MSHYLLLNSWMGGDQDEATDKMARVFRLSNEEAGPIVDLLANGNPWQFEYQVSDQQTEVARNYLQDLGFDVETIPAIVKGGAPASMATEMPSPQPEKGGVLKGIMAKLAGVFSRKKKEPLPETEMEMEPDPYMEASMESGFDTSLEAERRDDEEMGSDWGSEETEFDREPGDEFERGPDDEFRDDRR